MAQYPLLSGDHPINVTSGFSELNYFDRLKLKANVLLCKLSIQYRNSGEAYPLDLYWHKLWESSLTTIENEDQTGELSLEEWKTLTSTSIHSLDELDQFYQTVADELGVDILGFRWNQGISYSKKWLRTDDHYWITIIRNPLDRACSSKKTHSWSWAESLRSTLSYFEHLEAMRDHPRVHILYYEDLVADGVSELKDVYDTLDTSLTDVNTDSLRGQDGEQYRAESADLVDEHGTHKVGEPTNELYTKSINRYEEEMPQSVLKKFRQKLSTVPLLERYDMGQ
jgi:hypothetical protein